MTKILWTMDITLMSMDSVPLGIPTYRISFMSAQFGLMSARDIVR